MAVRIRLLSLSAPLLAACAASIAEAQFTDLTTPVDGTELYYALKVPNPVPDSFAFFPPAGPIYKIGSEPATLFLSLQPPVFPPHPPITMSAAYYLSPYYLVSHPQFSRDGQVFAYTGQRICLGGSDGCATKEIFQTVVSGIPGLDTQTFSGRGWLSGNGRYLFTDQSAFPQSGLLPNVHVLMDLQTGTSVYPNISQATYSNTGRVVADDGSVALACDPGLCIYHDPELIQSAQVAAEPTIDAGASTVVYTSGQKSACGASLCSRYLRIYHLTSRQDTVFLHGTGEVYAPAISADGRRVMFLSTVQWGTSDPPGMSQLYTINIDGTGFRELTSFSEPAGVVQHTMTDDGQVAWYLSGDGKLVKLCLAGETPVRTEYRAAAVDLSPVMAPGSAVTLQGAGLSDATYAPDQDTPPPAELGGVRVVINGMQAPMLSVSPTTIDFQVPWEIPTGEPATIQVITAAGTPQESAAQAVVTPVASFPALMPKEACSMPYCWEDLGGGAIHQDWSGFVAFDSPALSGETLHFLGTGFGPVQPPATTGVAAPVDTPVTATTPVPDCTLNQPNTAPDVQFVGLAPGLVGYYQMDVQLPATIRLVDPSYHAVELTCGGTIVASIWVKPTQ